jgi:hypothetical protein
LNTEVYNTISGAELGVKAFVNMTANNTPSPQVASASAETSANYQAWKALNGVVGTSDQTFWQADSTSAWLKLDLGSGNEKAVTIYSVYARGYVNTNNTPKDWTFEGSNDDDAWTVLDTVTDETAWSLSEGRTFSFSNTTTYRYYRINVTAVNGGANCDIGDLRFYENSIENQFTLPAGTYMVEASAPACAVLSHIAVLYNISDSEISLSGSSSRSSNVSGSSIRSFITGVFTISGTKVFEIQHRCESTETNVGFGRACNLGVSEIYTQVKITKLA